MGIFAWLDKQFRCEGVMTPVKARPAPEVPPVKVIKLDQIPEPVISLIASLGRDEWELSAPRSCTISESTYITNVFYEHITLHMMHPWCLDKHYEILGADWMTEREKAAVIEAISPRAEWLRDLNTRTKYARQRNKFMCLVEEA